MMMDQQDGMLNNRQMMRQPRAMPGAQVMPPPGAQGMPGAAGGTSNQQMATANQTPQAMAETPQNPTVDAPAPPGGAGLAGDPGGVGVSNQAQAQGGNAATGLPAAPGGNQNAVAASQSPTGAVGANLPQTPGFRPRRPSMPPPGGIKPAGPTPQSTM